MTCRWKPRRWKSRDALSASELAEPRHVQHSYRTRVSRAVAAAFRHPQAQPRLPADADVGPPTAAFPRRRGPPPRGRCATVTRSSACALADHDAVHAAVQILFIQPASRRRVRSNVGPGAEPTICHQDSAEAVPTFVFSISCFNPRANPRGRSIPSPNKSVALSWQQQPTACLPHSPPLPLRPLL